MSVKSRVQTFLHSKQTKKKADRAFRRPVPACREYLLSPVARAEQHPDSCCSRLMSIWSYTLQSKSTHTHTSGKVHLGSASTNHFLLSASLSVTYSSTFSHTKAADCIQSKTKSYMKLIFHHCFPSLLLPLTFDPFAAHVEARVDQS